MIVPSPAHAALLGCALYVELACGLWRALALPWLVPCGSGAPAVRPEPSTAPTPARPRRAAPHLRLVASRD